MNELGDYVSESQENRMYYLENQIKTVSTIAEQKEAMKEFDSILEDINTEKQNSEMELYAVQEVETEQYNVQEEVEQLAAQAEEEYQEPNDEEYVTTSTSSFRSLGVIY